MAGTLPDRAGDAARDEEDVRLLEAGDFARLLAVYYPIILLRLRIRLSIEEAEEVRQRVVAHLLGELRAGKVYEAPFRVVVHQRTTWKLLDYFEERKRKQNEVELPEDELEQARDEYRRVEADIDFGRLVTELPARERQVIEMRWRQGLDVPAIAELLGIEANAVHQALHRAHGRLRKSFG